MMTYPSLKDFEFPKRYIAATIKSWDGYIQETDSRMKKRFAGTSTCLWMGEVPGRRDRAHQGEIRVEPATKGCRKRCRRVASSRSLNTPDRSRLQLWSERVSPILRKARMLVLL